MTAATILGSAISAFLVIQRVGTIVKMKDESHQTEAAELYAEAPTHEHKHEVEKGDGEEAEEGIEQLRDGAKQIAVRVIAELHEAKEMSNFTFLAQGTYHHVWLITYVVVCKCCPISPIAEVLNGPQESASEASHAREEKQLVLRVARDTPSLEAYQVRHEVACLRFLEEHLPSIPAPRVRAWDVGSSRAGPAYIAEDFVPVQRLSVAWPELTEAQKTTVSREIASVVADLGETRFHSIGGLALDSPAGPTIEAAKLFHGRVVILVSHPALRRVCSAVVTDHHTGKVPFASTLRYRALH
jgi:hypothetical protein